MKHTFCRLHLNRITLLSGTDPTQIHVTGEATGFIPAPGDKGKVVTVMGTNSGDEFWED